MPYWAFSCFAPSQTDVDEIKAGTACAKFGLLTPVDFILDLNGLWGALKAFRHEHDCAQRRGPGSDSGNFR